MENLLEKVYRWIVRDPTLSFQIRLFRLACIASAFVSLTTITPTSYAENIPISVVIGTVIVGFFSLYCYWRSCQGHHHTVSLFVGINLLLDPIWFWNAGADGGVPYFFYPIFLYPMLMWRGKTRWIATGSLVANVMALQLLEYYVPSLKIPFQTPHDRYVDLLIGTAGSYFCMGIFLWMIIANYDWEQRLLKQTQDQLLRTQRMDTLGSLSSGIAHDFNNILSPILLSIHMLREENSQAERQAILDTLELNAQKGSDIVQQLLTFNRGNAHHILVRPKNLVHEMVQMTKRTFPKSIIVKTETERSSLAIHADPTQIHQVLLNLCVNARDAMPNGGTLLLGLETVHLEPAAIQKHSHGKPGPYVILKVQDSGTGIPAEIRERIFEPFFTTKPPGKGTGLGLAAVQTIVNKHSGFIEIDSKPGKGTLFSVYLPAIPNSTDPDIQTERVAPPRGRGECILVVDDEPAFRHATEKTLISSNYRVLTADNGAKGLEIYTEKKEEIGLVILDMMMPVMDGAEALSALHRLNPKIKVIVASGAMTTTQASTISQLPVKARLAKPFTAGTLLSTMRSVLDN